MSHLIELQDIHFSYAPDNTPLKGVNLIVNEGDKLAINGPNGAGKSTLFQIMVGLIKPSSGQIIMFEKERREEKDFFEVRQKCGLVFQDPDDQLFCPTVFEDLAFGLLNLGFDKDHVFEKIENTLKSLELDHLRNRATHNLSGGEKRLVSLASVMVMEPEVLLLDEPTNALDVKTRDKLVDILHNLKQSIVLISHDSHFRRKIVSNSLDLEDGQLVEATPKCAHAQ